MVSRCFVACSGVPQVNGKAFDIKLMCGWLAELLPQYSDEHASLLQISSFNLARTQLCCVLMLSSLIEFEAFLFPNLFV